MCWPTSWNVSGFVVCVEKTVSHECSSFDGLDVLRRSGAANARARPRAAAQLSIGVPLLQRGGTLPGFLGGGQATGIRGASVGPRHPPSVGGGGRVGGAVAATESGHSVLPRVQGQPAGIDR